MSRLTVAICSYNRAYRLHNLVTALRAQKCPVPFEILIVDNNCTDNTQQVVQELSKLNGVPLRYVKEKQQGIVYARNRAIEETKNSTYLSYIDDDEFPCPNWLKVAVDALEREGADCVGGEIRIRLPFTKRISWLEDELLGFLGAVNYSSAPFWITEHHTPIWSGNIAYKTSIFADGLRFDSRYNREGLSIGGGEDAIMFYTLIERGMRIRYRPDMAIQHFIEESKLKRRYFLKLHFLSGQKFGQYADGKYKRTIFGVPPFMLIQAAHQWNRALLKFLKHESGALRQSMNGAYATGMIVGRIQRWKDNDQNV